MKKNLYAMRDRLNGFLSPMVDIDDQNAMRNFDVGCRNNGVIWFNSGDFSLYRIGEFDDESGEITPIIPPVFLMNAIDHTMDKENEKND